MKAKARALGFDAVGFARADEPLDADHARYEAFLADGMHGTMQYLADFAAVRRRLDTDAILAGARTVICVARRHGAGGETAGVARGIARYARGHDYHSVVRKRLRRLAAFVRTLGDDEGGAPVSARPMVDDVPVLERAWAVRAGLGFVGKNGLLIVPGEGSFVLLGEVVTTLELPPDAPMAERCGACTRCLDACPTRAFVRPFVLDPRRCVAYLTIELRGPIPEDLRDGVGEHLFGCDDCQTVCPFNGGARGRAASPGPFEPLAAWEGLDEEQLLGLEDASFRARSVGSPVQRAGREGMARNAAIVLGNRRDARSRPALERAAEGDASDVVRDAARWALERFRG